MTARFKNGRSFDDSVMEDDHIDAEEDDDDEAESNNEDSPKKKQKLSAERPLCTNCEQCQIRKGKCDRGRPRCGWCITNDRVCKYLVKKKPGLRAGYGRDLEKRVLKVEELIRDHAQLLEEFVQLKQSIRLHSDLLNTGTGIGPGSAQPQLKYASSVKGTIASEIDQTSNSPLTPAGISQGSPRNYRRSDSLNISGYINPRNKTGDSEEFPPYDLLYSIVDLYFSHVNTWCPILDRKTTLQVLFGTHALEEDDRILLHSMVAVAMRFSNDQRLDDQTRQAYYNNSKQRVLLYGIENSSIRGLQAMVILALDLHGSASIGGGLKMIALLARSAIQLGINTESTSPLISPNYPSISTLRANVLPEPKTWIEDESRRRLFWMVYVLDRDATVATAFDCALDEKDIDRKLPCREDQFSKDQVVPTRWFRTSKREDYSMNNPQNLGPFSYQVEIKGLISQIHQFLKRPMDVGALADVSAWQGRYRELDLQIRTWQLSLPTEYDMGRISSLSDDSRLPVTPGWILLQASYFFALIRLHSSAAYPPHRSPIFGPSYAASQQCYSAVENIVILAKYAVNYNILNQVGVSFAFTVWVGARVLLVHGSTIEKHVSQDINFLISTLEAIGVHWPLANRYATILSRVVEEYQESQARVMTDGKAETPPSVTILADMRRTALDLELLISRAPRPQQLTSNPAQISVPSEAEQNYLEAFDFFNYPRLPTGDLLADSNYQRFDLDQLGTSNFTIDATSDWLAGSLT